MIYYISGAITNDWNYREKFALAEQYLKSFDCEVINPAEISAHLPKLSYSAYMDISLALLEQADGIYLLPDWTDSIGARLEKAYAEAHRKVFWYAEVAAYETSD